LASVRRVGLDVTLSGIYAALHQPGVQRVTLPEPTANVEITNTEAAYCTARTVTIAGVDE
jgi:phage-related baseplate assembly protein